VQEANMAANGRACLKHDETNDRSLLAGAENDLVKSFGETVCSAKEELSMAEFAVRVPAAESDRVAAAETVPVIAKRHAE
jgi:hypothetical protein